MPKFQPIPNFDSLAPTTTKGDIIVRTATTNVRIAIGSDGQALIADSTQTDGLKWAGVSASVLSQGVKTVFTSGGTFTTPSTSSSSTIYQYAIVGGGGGGGGATTSGGSGVGGGGGGGAVAIGTFTSVAASTSITVTIGGAGAAGNTSGGNGGAGGDSSLGAPVSITASGAAGGVGTNSSSAIAVLGGSGGTVTGSPQINIPGGNGTIGLLNGSFLIGGNGSPTAFGAGGTGAAGSGVNIVAEAAKGFGSGGGGGQGNQVATAGTPGIVIITQLTP